MLGSRLTRRLFVWVFGDVDGVSVYERVSDRSTNYCLVCITLDYSLYLQSSHHHDRITQTPVDTLLAHKTNPNRYSLPLDNYIITITTRLHKHIT